MKPEDSTTDAHGCTRISETEGGEDGASGGSLPWREAREVERFCSV
jgi:hypothetical protein